MKLKKQFVVILLGPSGSGKGTQAEFLMKKLTRVHYIQTGRLLRQFVKMKKSETARLVKKIMQNGKLVPPFVSSFIWMGAVFGMVKKGESIIFDGSPRTLEEAKNLNLILSWLAFPHPKVVYLTLTSRGVMKRLLLRGRFDDTHGAIRERLHFFKKDVMPVIRYYKKQGRLVTIDGNQTVEEVWRDIKKALHI